ncbi:hypothetical protein BURMUCF2_A0109 [Burkholderia multivorans CF2]|nr:hypothetical protein BURMUCF2_A0109 [Burkholderia multivorans CF2]
MSGPRHISAARTHIGRDESSSAVHRRATYATERAQRLRCAARVRS